MNDLKEIFFGITMLFLSWIYFRLCWMVFRYIGDDFLLILFIFSIIIALHWYLMKKYYRLILGEDLDFTNAFFTAYFILSFVLAFEKPIGKLIVKLVPFFG